ncbi:MAG: hypothetical protein ACLTBV_14010 [Enterocloster bolteae]
MVSVVLTHCIVEIIYHFDFEKMFSHRLQLGLCLAAGILVFLSFRYDWYGYDSYIPSEEKVSIRQPGYQVWTADGSQIRLWRQAVSGEAADTICRPYEYRRKHGAHR